MGEGQGQPGVGECEEWHDDETHPRMKCHFQPLDWRQRFASRDLGHLQRVPIPGVTTSLVTDRMRGRVMSMFLLTFMGTMPIGNIIAGAASNEFGPQYTLALGGFVVTIAATGVAIFNKRLRELH